MIKIQMVFFSRASMVVLTLLFSFTLLSLVSSTYGASELTESEISKKLTDFCDKVNQRFDQYQWDRIICNPTTWIWDAKYTTPGGYPLVYQEFASQSPVSTTLVFCGVHGDEPPSVYQCVHLVRDILYDNSTDYLNSTVVIAPLINPDGFLRAKPTRQNGRGIDLNRNFPTKDFDERALAEWKKKYRSTRRKFPGNKGGSEIETQFQMMLINKYKPDKIISIHSPLGWLDVDSPLGIIKDDEPDGYEFKDFAKKARDVAVVMSRNSNNFKLINFRVYPGSLGNYAAHERGIPVYTLELENSDPHQGHRYWNKMKKALVLAIQYEISRSPKKIL